MTLIVVAASAQAAPNEPPPNNPAPNKTARNKSTLGEGASPGNAHGKGGFVPRGSLRNFYAASGGRLWYYMNNYYWVPKSALRKDLWIKAEVTESFSGLRKWPDGKTVKGPVPKVTVEYWLVGTKGRTVRIDNHKDYLLLADNYTAGKISVKVTLTLGALQVKDKKGIWGDSPKSYVLESRNYSGGGGLGASHTRFVPLRTEAVTVWGYEIPWDTHPQRLTRSNWRRLKMPKWKLITRRAPAVPTTSQAPTTPSATTSR